MSILPHPNSSTLFKLVVMQHMQVRKTMCRIKQVLTERALAEEDASKRKRLREIINAM
jgi:hypothetical protein